MFKVNVQFPNLDPSPIPVDVVKMWNHRDHNVIGDYIFFWVGDSYVGMELSDFTNIFGVPVVPPLGSDIKISDSSVRIDVDSKSDSTVDQELIDIFSESCRKNMVYWSIDNFKKTHPRLLKSILESMEVVRTNVLSIERKKSKNPFGWGFIDFLKKL